MENRVHQCIYDIFSSDIPEVAKLPAPQHYKSKIVRLNARRMEVMLDNNAQDKLEGEEPPLFHILKMVERRETRAIRRILDTQGNIATSQYDVLNTFVTQLRRIYQPR